MFTDKNCSNEELQAQLDLYCKIIDRLSEGIILADPDSGLLLYGNHGFKRLFLYENEDIERLHSAELHPKDYANTAKKISTSANDFNEPLPDVPCIKKDGTLFYCNIRDEVFEFKTHTYNLKTFTDTSEQFVSSRKLGDSEERWKFALEGTNDGVWDWDLNTGKVFFSERWKTMLGYEPEDISNDLEEWSRRVHPDDMEKCLVSIHEHLEGKQPFYMNTHRLLCKDGSYKWILDRGKITNRSSDGFALRMIGTHTDLTDRYEMEEQLKKLNNDKDRFMHILAHDLRVPFNTLLGFSAHLLENLDKFDKEKIHKQLSTIHNTTQNTYNLLDELLMWIKSQEGKLPLTNEKIVLSQLVRDVFAQMIQQSEHKSIALSCEIEGGLVVNSDINILKTILRNLVSNAIKFTHENGKVNITAEKQISHLKICVSDNGIGIENSNLEKIWDYTNKLVEKGTFGEKGTGFGLTLCNELVGRLGGEISVESSMGSGSKFCFTVPLDNNW